MAFINLNIDYLLSEIYKSFYTMPLMIILNILLLVVAVKAVTGKVYSLINK